VPGADKVVACVLLAGLKPLPALRFDSSYRGAARGEL
jgi:hypothetical protein